jgi:hypothetical protein
VRGGSTAQVFHLALADEILDRPGHILHRHVRVYAVLIKKVDPVGIETPE